MKRSLSAAERQSLLDVLFDRFGKHKARHNEIDWKIVEAKLSKAGDALWSLSQMEESGGEPDVIAFDKRKNEITFCDCSAESPKDRRSLCYDERALNERKENRPAGSAMNICEQMGVEMLDEEQYRYLQTLGEFDLKTSSWIRTPEKIRKLGGALFCDRRYDHVFVYHNGASSYYAARGFRALLKF